MSELKYTLDPLGRRDFENWHSDTMKGCTIILKGSDYPEITEPANDIFILDNFISKDECNAIIARMEKNPEEQFLGISGNTPRELENEAASNWKNGSTDWSLTRYAVEGDEALDLDLLLVEKFRKYFIDLEQHYHKSPYPGSPQTWEEYQNGQYPTLGNLFRIREDEGFLIQKTGVGGYYKWHVDTRNGTYRGTRRVFATCLYLNDDFQGGETIFVRQGIKVRAKAGRLVVFYSDFTHLHAGCPVTKGTKYLLFNSYMHGDMHEHDMIQIKTKKKND